MAPKTGLGKVFTIIYIFVGLGMLIGFIEIIGESVMKSKLVTRPQENTKTEEK